MSKATDAPADEVKRWPLVLCVFMLIAGALVYRRLGNDRIALLFAVLAVVTPLVGHGLRLYLSRGKVQRVRRVLVDDEPAPIAYTPLESAKYLPVTPRLRASDEAAARA